MEERPPAKPNPDSTDPYGTTGGSDGPGSGTGTGSDAGGIDGVGEGAGVGEGDPEPRDPLDPPDPPDDRRDERACSSAAFAWLSRRAATAAPYAMSSAAPVPPAFCATAT